MCAVGIIVIVLMRGLPDNRIFDVLRLCVVVPLAAGIYIAAAKLLRIVMLSLLTSANHH